MGVFDQWFGKGGFFGKVRMRYVHTFGRQSTAFDKDAYEQATVRAIIDCIATHTAKAEALHVIEDKDGRIQEIKRDCPITRLLNERPNEIMCGYDLKYKAVTQVENYTTALLYIDWDEVYGRDVPRAIYPVNFKTYEFMQLVSGGWVVAFTASTGEEYVLPLEDVVVLRKFYNTKDISGDGNSPVYHTLDLINTAEAGLADAVLVSNQVRGILKQKNRLNEEDVQKSAKAFSDNMKKAAKDGGVVGMDLVEEYIPVKADTYSLTANQLKEIRDGLYRYWRISEDFLKSNYTEGQWQATFEAIIEPRLIQMGQAFTNACFSDSERQQGHRIIFVTSMLLHASTKTKINIIAASREIALFTTNELRAMFGYPPVEGGDTRQVSLNYTNAAKQDQYQGVQGEDEDEEEMTSDEDSQADTQE